jgi:hypothetical protein
MDSGMQEVNSGTHGVDSGTPGVDSGTQGWVKGPRGLIRGRRLAVSSRCLLLLLLFYCSSCGLYICFIVLVLFCLVYTPESCCHLKLHEMREKK